MVPAVEFIGAAVEVGGPLEAQAFMEEGTVFGEEGVVFFCIGDAGFQVVDMLFYEEAFKGSIEHFPQAFMMGGHVYIDGELRAVLVGFSCFEGAGVGIAFDDAFFFDDELGIGCKGMCDPFPEFGKGRGIVFEGDGCFFYVRTVDGKKGRGVFFCGGADGDAIFHIFRRLFP